MFFFLRAFQVPSLQTRLSPHASNTGSSESCLCLEARKQGHKQQRLTSLSFSFFVVSRFALANSSFEEVTMNVYLLHGNIEQETERSVYPSVCSSPSTPTTKEHHVVSCCSLATCRMASIPTRTLLQHHIGIKSHSTQRHTCRNTWVTMKRSFSLTLNWDETFETEKRGGGGFEEREWMTGETKNKVISFWRTKDQTWSWCGDRVLTNYGPTITEL